MITTKEALGLLNDDIGYYKHASMRDAVRRYFDKFGTIEDVSFLTLSEENPTRQRFIEMVDRAIEYNERITDEMVEADLMSDVPEDAIL